MSAIRIAYRIALRGTPPTTGADRDLVSGRERGSAGRSVRLLNPYAFEGGEVPGSHGGAGKARTASQQNFALDPVSAIGEAEDHASSQNLVDLGENRTRQVVDIEGSQSGTRQEPRPPFSHTL